MAVAEASHGLRLPRAATDALVRGDTIEAAIAAAGLAVDGPTTAAFAALRALDQMLAHDTEIPAILHALDGGFIRPAPGGDLLRTPAILPTGRNLHGFDPFKLPSAFACRDGARQAERLLARHMADGNGLPETVAMVLWGTDNLKTEGAPLAQVMALLGTRPRFDGYGRLAGATLIPLAELGRPRIDVVITMSGIFRDLLPLQIRLLAEACFLAASADEPAEENFIRKHALAYQAAHGCDLATASLRVFGNADGAYGSNVNNLLESGRWQDEDELAETYTRREKLRLRARRAAGGAGRVAPQRAGRRRARLPEPRQRGTRRHVGRHLLRHAGRHQPRGAPRQGWCGGAGLHRRPDARRGHGAHAGRAGVAGNRAPASSTRSGPRAC